VHALKFVLSFMKSLTRTL